MGSEIVQAVVQQIGRIITNPNAIAPDVSRPIEQIAVDPFVRSFQPLEQRGVLEFAEGIPAGSPGTTPAIIEQRGVRTFAGGAAVEGADGSVLQQFILASEPQKSEASSYEGPIEQLEFTTADLRGDGGPDVSNPIQQFILSNTVSRSNPVEQVANVTNTASITQFDFIELIFPVCNSTKVPVTTDILWRIKDFGFPFNIETLIFKVNGVPVQDTSNFSITAIAGGLQLDFDPPDDFGFSEEVEVFLDIEDTAVPPNAFIFRCKWTTVPDTRAPIITNVEPECDSTDVDVRAPVEFDVLDVGAGVDQTTIRLTIEGVTVCSGVSFEPITVSGSGSGFHVTFDHLDDPFRFESFVTIGVEATDLSPQRNSSLFVCCFQTEQSEIPTFINFNPDPCESFVDNTTGLTFEVYGVEDGIDISTLEVRVDNGLRRVFVRPRVLRSQ